MNLFAAIGLGSSVVALMIIAVSALVILRRVTALRRRAAALQTHPALSALAGARAIQTSLAGIPGEIAAIRTRLPRISKDMAELIASSARLQLQVDRISFATTLLLKTFIPKLRGSLSD